MTARQARLIPVATAEDFEIQVSTSGTDPIAPGSITISTQAEADAWGAFRTIGGARAALPRLVTHHVTIRLPAGTWVTEADPFSFGDLTYPQVTGVGWITVAGDDSWSQVAGTPVSMAVTSSDGLGNVTLAADPSLTANAFRGYYLLVLSGKDAGQFKPIRSHTGAAFVVAGGFSGGLDGTSVVRIVERATTIQVASSSVTMDGGLAIHPSHWTLELWGVNIVADPGDASWYMSPRQISLGLSGGTRLVEGGIFGGMANFAFEDCVIDVSAGDWASSAINVQGGLVRTSWGSSRPMLVIGDGVTAAKPAIVVGSVGGNSGLGVGAGVFMFGNQCFDGWTRSCILAKYTGATVWLAASSGQFPRSDQAADYAIVCEKGATAYLADLSGFATSTFKGTSNDFDLDGLVNDSWSNLNAAIGKVMSSSRLSAIMED